MEDIYYLMTITKRAPHPQKLAEFYSKLGLVFSRAKMDLFHSCTQHKLFKLTRDLRKNLSQAELSLLASKMLIATLSIPITEVKHGLGNVFIMISYFFQMLFFCIICVEILVTFSLKWNV